MDRLGTVTVVGVGLIGGSVGRALKARSLADRVVGIGRSRASLEGALRVGAIDEATTDPVEGVAGADVVVVCTPVPLIVEGVATAAHHGPAGLLVTDAGSTKRSIVEGAERDERARAVFVGGHPIAGSERKGPEHSDAQLFEGRTCVLTPTPRTPADRLARARDFWSAIGCRVVELSPAAHDQALALTSHLPHAVAAALAATVPVEALGLAAGAYRDGTRVAGSDADLWAGIFRDNRDALLQAISRFQGQFDAFRRALEADDLAAMCAWWEAARDRRKRFREPGDGPDAAVED